MHLLCLNEANGGHIGGAADIVGEVLTVSGYCWDKINIG